MSDTVHAEQAATINAWTHGERQLVMLAVTAAPCGQCRQFLAELENAQELRVLIDGIRATTLARLLPRAFGPAELKSTARLLHTRRHRIFLKDEPTDPLTRAALAAARSCYAPYTRAYAGVAVATRRSTYAGRYAENAAFNPTIAPLNAALSTLILGGEEFCNIQRIVLVRSAVWVPKTRPGAVTCGFAMAGRASSDAARIGAWCVSTVLSV